MRLISHACPLLTPICFNPRTREGCDGCLVKCAVLLTSFNPRTREGCDARVIPPLRAKAGRFQSTHPRGVRHYGNKNKRWQYYVSIHAPARGATASVSLTSFTLACFNPRTREGCDVSVLLFPPRTPCFNPRTREGCDLRYSYRSIIPSMFQSTHPRGVRPKAAGITAAISDVSIHAPARGAT